MKTPPQQHFHASHLVGDNPAGPTGDAADDLMALLAFPSSQFLLLKAELAFRDQALAPSPIPSQQHSGLLSPE